MRQLVDLLVWAALVAVLAAVVSLTPRVAQYVFSEGQPPDSTPASQGIAFNLPASPEEGR
jgi:hypothetical protein